MKKYIKNYLKAYWYGEGDFIPCEVCWAQWVDIHHCIFKSQWGKDDASNLIALCRDDHDRAHFKKEPYLKPEYLLNKKRIK